MNPRATDLVWLLSLTLLFIATEASFLIHKADIIIYNDLNIGVDLTIHCKSKNDDLGVHVLAYRNHFEFKFRPHFWGNTLFFCNMQWNGGSHWFDIYEQNRDSRHCNRCLWNITPKGPCMFNSKTAKYDMCYP
ncbi:dirigent protein 16-like [Hibiscus syriacus]|uniref:S-protein homolog n=1 Tax=Hibiscus syriacus TaxID=106335 RepID=A0A6A3B934_HIBSY|nr:dirigent protein 16-like [Hibiscus syriacus]